MALENECVVCLELGRSKRAGLTLLSCPACKDPVHSRCLSNHTCQKDREQAYDTADSLLYYPQVFLIGALNGVTRFVMRFLGRELNELADQAAGVPKGYRVVVCPGCDKRTHALRQDDERRSRCTECSAPLYPKG